MIKVNSRNRLNDCLFWIFMSKRRQMLDAGRPGLVCGFCDQPRQCHVTVGRKTRENNLDNKNDFSNWIRLFSHRRTQTPMDSMFEEKRRLWLSS